MPDPTAPFVVPPELQKYVDNTEKATALYQSLYSASAKSGQPLDPQIVSEYKLTQQYNYDKLNAAGFFNAKTNPGGAAWGHQVRTSGVITDNTQGGTVDPPGPPGYIGAYGNQPPVAPPPQKPLLQRVEALPSAAWDGMKKFPAALGKSLVGLGHTLADLSTSSYLHDNLQNGTTGATNPAEQKAVYDQTVAADSKAGGDLQDTGLGIIGGPKGLVASGYNAARNGQFSAFAKGVPAGMGNDYLDDPFGATVKVLSITPFGKLGMLAGAAKAAKVSETLAYTSKVMAAGGDAAEAARYAKAAAVHGTISDALHQGAAALDRATNLGPVGDAVNRGVGNVADAVAPGSAFANLSRLNLLNRLATKAAAGGHMDLAESLRGAAQQFNPDPSKRPLSAADKASATPLTPSVGASGVDQFRASSPTSLVPGFAAPAQTGSAPAAPMSALAQRLAPFTATPPPNPVATPFVPAALLTAPQPPNPTAAPLVPARPFTALSPPPPALSAPFAVPSRTAPPEPLNESPSVFSVKAPEPQVKSVALGGGSAVANLLSRPGSTNPAVLMPRGYSLPGGNTTTGPNAPAQNTASAPAQAPQPQAPPLQPAPDVVPSAANSFGMVRSIGTTGHGRATVTFNSADQMLWHDLGSKLRRNTTQMSQAQRTALNGNVQGEISGLMHRHGLTAEAARQTARDVWDDASSQRKGLQDGANITLKDNVTPGRGPAGVDAAVAPRGHAVTSQGHSGVDCPRAKTTRPEPGC